MKKYILLCFLLGLTTNLFSQRYTWDEFMDKMDEDQITYQEIKTIIDHNSNRQGAYEDKAFFTLVTKRAISQLDSCYEDLYEVMIAAEYKKQYKRRKLRILHRNNQIIKTTSWTLTPGQLDEIEVNILKKELYDEYKSDFKTANYTASENGLFEPDSLFLVGIACGGKRVITRASYTPKFKELLSLIESKNKEKIIEWCQSTSPEIRCYGAMGLNTLQRLDHDLSSQELKLLGRISKEETTINHCSGCTGFGYNSTVSEMYQKVNSTLISIYPNIE